MAGSLNVTGATSPGLISVDEINVSEVFSKKTIAAKNRGRRIPEKRPAYLRGGINRFNFFLFQPVILTIGIFATLDSKDSGQSCRKRQVKVVKCFRFPDNFIIYETVMLKLQPGSYTLFFLTCLLFGVPNRAHTEEPMVKTPTERVHNHIKSTKKKKRRRRRCSSHASPRYRQMVKNWRKQPKIPKPKFRDGFRDLTLYAVNHGERLRFFPYLKDGTLDPQFNDDIQRIFRDKDTDAEHPIHPRLIKLLYRVADRVGAKQITIISGYRENPGETGESKHAKGHAVDFMIPGVALGRVARIIRSFGHVGVGFYPASGFVHMDVRDGPSYFWIDRSGPGKRSCVRRMLSKQAAKADRKYRPKHDEPKQHKNKKGEPRGFITPDPPPPPPSPADGELNEENELNLLSSPPMP